MLRLLLFASLVCALCPGLWAQSEAGSATLNGTVTDPTAASVAGARVTLTNPGTGFTRVLETNEAGLYSFIRVPPGAYNLSVEKSGFRGVKREGIALAVGAVLSLDFQLEIGQTTETVTVTGEVPLVESTRSQTSTNVNERAVRELPINGRNFLDFTTLTPGVVRDPRGGDLSFGGQRGTSNSLLVDGMDSNNLFFGQSAGRAGTRNPYSFSQDAVQEFQVNTNGYAPEIGRAGGGVVNVVTKSGTNQLHGNAFWFYRDRFMNANTSINKSRGIVRQPYHFNQFGGTVGGPIVKDKLFFFASYDGQRNKNPNPVFYPFLIANPSALQQAALNELNPFLASYTTGSDNDIGLAKVDWNLSDTQRLSVRYNIHRFRGANFENAGNRSARERTGNSNVSTNHLAVNYTKTFGSSVFWDARVNWLKDDQPGLANSDKPEAQVFEAGQLYLAIGRNNFSPRYTNSQRFQTIQSVSYVRGKHTYKVGGDLNFERIDNFFPGNFSGSFQFNSLADFATRSAFQLTQGFAGQGTNGPLTKPNINELAIFVQDTWRATQRLTLNYGWRYDQMRYAQPPVLNPDAGLAQLGLKTNFINTDTNNHAVRFGFAYRLDNEGRQLIRGGYGMFYARTPSILIGTAHSQNGIQVQTYAVRAPNLPTYPNILPAPPNVARTPAIYVVDPLYVQPLTAQWNFNYESQIGRDIGVTLGYLGVRGYHLTRSRDINLFPSQRIDATYSSGLPTYFFGRLNRNRPLSNFDRITLFDSGGDSTYHGAFVQVNKRFAQNFQFLASYTWSKVIDTVPDATSVVVGTGDDAKVAMDTLLPGNDRAVGDAHVPHRFVGSGVWDVTYYRGQNPAARLLLNGWQLSVIAEIRTGLPFSPTVGGNSDINNDGNARTDRPPFLGRNFYQLPEYKTVDLRVAKTIPLAGERLRLRLIGEAFNSFNRANFSNVNRSPFTYNATTRIFTPLANFNVFNASFDPRILQLAAKIEF